MSAMGGDTYARARIRRPEGDYVPPPLPMGYTPRPASDLVTAKPKAAPDTTETPADGRGTDPATASPAGGTTPAGAPAPSHQPDPARSVTSEQVLAYLRQHSRAKPAHIAQALGVDLSAVGHRLADLHRNRLAHRATRGRWTAAPERNRDVATLEQVREACAGLGRFTAQDIARKLDAETKTVRNRLVDLVAAGDLLRLQRGVYRDAAWQPPARADAERHTKQDTVRAILRHAAGALSAREIWAQEPDRFGGDDPTRVCAMLDALRRRGLAEVVPGSKPQLWYDSAAWPDGPPARSAIEDEADAERHTKQDTVRAILRHAAGALSAREIWAQEPDRFGGDDPTRVCAMLDALRRRGLAEVVPGSKPQLWYDSAAWPDGPPAHSAVEDEAGAGHGEAASEAGLDRVFADLETATDVSGLVQPLPEHQHQVRRLRGLAAQTLLDPIVRGWLSELADDIEQQHQTLEPQA